MAGPVHTYLMPGNAAPEHQGLKAQGSEHGAGNQVSLEDIFDFDRFLDSNETTLWQYDVGTWLPDPSLMADESNASIQEISYDPTGVLPLQSGIEPIETNAPHAEGPPVKFVDPRLIMASGSDLTSVSLDNPVPNLPTSFDSQLFVPDLFNGDSLSSTSFTFDSEAYNLAPPPNSAFWPPATDNLQITKPRTHTLNPWSYQNVMDLDFPGDMFGSSEFQVPAFPAEDTLLHENQQHIEPILHPQPTRSLNETVAFLQDRVPEVVTEEPATRPPSSSPPAELSPHDSPATSRYTRSSSSEEESINIPVYRALAHRPPSWGTKRKFKYTETGELEHSIRMSPEEMMEFILENPRHVTLRIGRVPLGCNERYGKDSHGDRDGGMKCRLRCCLDKKGTMEKGTYRVILDEQRSEANIKHDPFHNAGYIHLWCLERWLDLPGLVRHPKVDVVVEDGRSHPIRGPRDHKYYGARLGSSSEIREAENFIESILSRRGPPRGYPLPNDRGTMDPEDLVAMDEDEEHGPYKGTLGWRLAVRKRELDSALSRHDNKRPKADRNAKSRFRDHLYDLAKQVPGRNKTRRASGQKQIRSGKRRRESSVYREHQVRTGVDAKDLAYYKRRRIGDVTTSSGTIALPTNIMDCVEERGLFIEQHTPEGDVQLAMRTQTQPPHNGYDSDSEWSKEERPSNEPAGPRRILCSNGVTSVVPTAPMTTEAVHAEEEADFESLFGYFDC